MGATKEIRLQGVPLSRGFAVAKACLLNDDRHANLTVYKVQDTEIERETARLDRAIDIAGKRLDEIQERVKQQLGPAEAEIFVAHKMILNDAKLREEIMTRMTDRGNNAEAAIVKVLDSYEARLAAIDDEYMSARATDFGEIKRRLLDVLGNLSISMQCDKEHCDQFGRRVVVAEHLTPSLTIEVNPEETAAFVTEHGGINCHAAILARAIGIPAVSGIPNLRDYISCGTELLINGGTGEVIVCPSEETISKATAENPQTIDGLPPAEEPLDNFMVMANVSLTSDISSALKMNAEGIGLYRTEFEIIAAERFFSEDELVERYTAAAEAMSGTRVIFRLFDIGSDKSLPFMEIPHENNPSLGWRGTRLLLGRDEILRTQARALARTSQGGRVHVMYPMIIDLDQFIEAKRRFTEAIEGIPAGKILHGIMFEVPSACLQAGELYEAIDFGSVGTNDLTQYLFAVDRENDMVSYDYNPDRPAFWKLLKLIADSAREAGKPLSVCGELAGYPKYVPKLIEVGINAVSVSPRRITEVRQAARAATATK